jgi:hypothetical protein
MENSKFIVLLLSSRSIDKTGFVQKEIRTAIEFWGYQPPGKIFLIPVRLDDCHARHRDLATIQYVDAFPNLDEALSRIRHSIQSQLRLDPGQALRDLVVCQHSVLRYENNWIWQMAAPWKPFVNTYLPAYSSARNRSSHCEHTLDLSLSLRHEFRHSLLDGRKRAGQQDLGLAESQ